VRAAVGMQVSSNAKTRATWRMVTPFGIRASERSAMAKVGDLT